MKTYDLIVVGAGPAGSTAARVAAEQGLSVVVLEARDVVGEPLQCAELVSARLPVPASILADCGCQSVSGLDLHIEGELTHAIKAPGLTLNRPAFDRLLADRAVECGARLELGRRVRAIDDTTVSCRDGETYRGKTIIGADGATSVVAKSIGVPAGELMIGQQVSAPLRQRENRAKLYFDRKYGSGYGWLFPKGARANVGVGVPIALKDRLGAELEDLVQRLDDGGFIVAAAAHTNAKGAIPIGGPRQLLCGRVLLVGDAAGLTHPITGAGIISALVSGEIAGNIVAEAVRQDDLSVLSEYEDEVMLALPMERFLEKRVCLLKQWDKKNLQQSVEAAWLHGPRDQTA